MKLSLCGHVKRQCKVALFMRAWIEIISECFNLKTYSVALFMRAWIEIDGGAKFVKICFVALFMRAWIEINKNYVYIPLFERSPSS